MFSGLIQERALVKEKHPLKEGGIRLVVLSENQDIVSSTIGASIAINGACMTLVEKASVSDAQNKESFHLCFDVSLESLNRTQLGELEPGSYVHLEPSLKLGDLVGGHLVSGHVDAVGEVQSLERQGEFVSLVLRIQGEGRPLVAPYLVEKGCLAVDGVSLTVNRVQDEPTYSDVFITLIPHTLEMTRFRDLKAGSKVNLEADLIAKYVDRAKAFRQNYIP